MNIFSNIFNTIEYKYKNNKEIILRNEANKTILRLPICTDMIIPDNTMVNINVLNRSKPEDKNLRKDLNNKDKKDNKDIVDNKDIINTINTIDSKILKNKDRLNLLLYSCKYTKGEILEEFKDKLFNKKTLLCLCDSKFYDVFMNVKISESSIMFQKSTNEQDKQKIRDINNINKFNTDNKQNFDNKQNIKNKKNIDNKQIINDRLNKKLLEYIAGNNLDISIYRDEIFEEDFFMNSNITITSNSYSFIFNIIGIIVCIAFPLIFSYIGKSVISILAKIEPNYRNFKIQGSTFVELDNLPEGTEECFICYQSFEKHEKIRKLSCNHYFHVDCVDKWIIGRSSACPLCRGVVPVVEITD